MKRDRKPTVQNDEISSVLKDYKDEIIINNKLIVPSSGLLKTIIGIYTQKLYGHEFISFLHILMTFSIIKNNIFKQLFMMMILIQPQVLNSSLDVEPQNDDSLIYVVNLHNLKNESSSNKSVIIFIKY